MGKWYNAWHMNSAVQPLSLDCVTPLSPESLTFPLEWYGRSIYTICSGFSLGKGIEDAALRIVKLAGLALLSISLVVTLPLYGMGKCWEFFESQIEKPLPAMFPKFSQGSSNTGYILDASGLTRAQIAGLEGKICGVDASQVGPIVRIAGDGNCWLYALLPGLRRAEVIDPQWTYRDLRAQIVHYMEAHHQHDRQLSQLIRAEIPATIHRVRRDLEVQIEICRAENRVEDVKKYEKRLTGLYSNGRSQSIDWYFRHMSCDRTHGGVPELYVVARLFRVNIQLWSEAAPDRNTHVRTLTQMNSDVLGCHGGDRGVVHIVFASSRNHFDCVIPQI